MAHGNSTSTHLRTTDRAQPRPPIKVMLHPLERETRRNMSLARRLGRRLDHQLRLVERQESDADLTPGAVDLPEGWLMTLATYSDIVVRLVQEQRRWLVAIHGKAAAQAQLDSGAESEELINAIELLSEDEFRAALKRRGVKESDLKSVVQDDSAREP